MSKSPSVFAVELLENRALLSAVGIGADFEVSGRPCSGLTPHGRAIGTDAAGNTVVAFTEADGNGGGVYVRRFDGTGAPFGPASRVHSGTAYHQSAPSLDVAADGSFVVTWVHEGSKAGSSQ